MSSEPALVVDASSADSSALTIIRSDPDGNLTMGSDPAIDKPKTTTHVGSAVTVDDNNNVASSPPPCCIPVCGCNLPTVGWSTFHVLCIGVAAFSAVTYMITMGIGISPAMKFKFDVHKIGVYCHIFPSALALILAPLQAHSWLRRWSVSAHKWAGRAYLLLGVLPGSMAGMYLALIAEGGVAAQSGFACLAVLWFSTAIAGWVAIACFRNLPWHQRLMTWNVALTFSAVTLRIYLPIGIVINAGEMIPPYRVIAWLCWVPNIPVVELYQLYSRCRSAE